MHLMYCVYWRRDSARQAEPKDYDISNPADGKRNLLKPTYRRIGGDGDEVGVACDYWN